MQNNTIFQCVSCALVFILIMYMILTPSQAAAEPFLPSRTWKVEKMMARPDGRRQDFFQSPHFQSQLSPRFSNVNYGANLRTQFPAYSHMGVPETPLDVNNYSNGNFNAVTNNMKALGGNPVATDTVAQLPGGIQASGIDANGDLKQPIVYDRYIFANRKSRLRRQGDPIRGDLPIVPNSGNWFTPSVHPNVDLQSGAINVLAGINNDTNKELSNLIYNSSGRADTAIGGVNMADVNMSGQNMISAQAGGGDVMVTSFP